MLSSGGAQNMRPASAPGEEAPTVGSADRNEVMISLIKMLLMNVFILISWMSSACSEVISSASSNWI